MQPTLFLSLFFLASCSLFSNKKLSLDYKKDIHKICLSAEGKGRLILDEQKHVFSFESNFQPTDGQWIMALNFPLYGAETIFLDWNELGTYDVKFSFADKILRQEKGISPEQLEIFITTWGEFLYELVRMKRNHEFHPQFIWTSSNKELMAITKLKKMNADLKVTFKNLTSDGFFGRYDIIMQHTDGIIPFGVEMIVRNCLEKTD